MLDDVRSKLQTRVIFFFFQSISCSLWHVLRFCVERTIVHIARKQKTLREQILRFASQSFTFVVSPSFHCFPIHDRAWKTHVHKQQQKTVVIFRPRLRNKPGQSKYNRQLKNIRAFWANIIKCSSELSASIHVSFSYR